MSPGRPQPALPAPPWRSCSAYSSNAAQHAKEHGIVEVTPELIDQIKANIEED